MKVITVTEEPKVETKISLVEKTVQLGRSNGYTFEVLPHRGVIERFTPKLGWTYQEYNPIRDEIPEEAQRRWDVVIDDNIPVAQVLIGHQIQFAPRNSGINIDKRKLAFAGAVIFGLLATGFFGLVILALIGTVLAAGAVGMALDPSLVLVLDDEEKTWVQVASWLD